MTRVAAVADRLDDAVRRTPFVDDRSTFLVVLVALVALLARLVFLGTRVAHFDEGRVAYWALHFLETGEFHYRYIVHGPFVQHVNALLFGLFGTSDFVMRLVVALIGASLPLVILLFREHLREEELVAGALFLAFNPVLLYYSRFYRSTIPVAAFALVAFGLFVRFSDTRRFRYFHGGVAFAALAFTAKENAAVYYLVWAGASLLLLDHTLFRPRNASSGVAWLRSWFVRTFRGRSWRAGPRFVGHLVLAVVLFLVVILFFYAPRSPTPDGVGLWNAFGDGNFWPVFEATWNRIEDGLNYWFGGGIESGTRYDSLVERWIDFGAHFLEVLTQYALPLLGFAIVGFVAERYSSRSPRNLVMFAGYWGFVSILGYPLGTDIKSAWVTANALVPLAIPAAVGAAILVRVLRDALVEDDDVSASIAAMIILLAVVLVGFVTVTAVYTNTTSADNGLVQYAQPEQDMRDTLADVHALAVENEQGVDVVIYGNSFVQQGGRIDPGCTDIGNTLPLEWYIARADANATCAEHEGDFDGELSGGNPPVVIAAESDADHVRDRLPSYAERNHRLRTTGGWAVFFLDLDRLNGTA